jgi:hypothetical protein
MMQWIPRRNTECIFYRKGNGRNGGICEVKSASECAWGVIGGFGRMGEMWMKVVMNL